MTMLVPLAVSGHAVPIVRLSETVQNVSYNAAGGASTPSSAFQATTEAILITSITSDTRIDISANPTASSSTTLLPKGSAMCFGVGTGWKIAVLGNDTNTGSICVTELVSNPA